MFNLEEYYQKAFSGEKVDNVEFIEYIKGFKSVVLWGASFQGQAIGKKLLEEGIKIDCYWDIRYKEFSEKVNGLEVVAPETANEPENTLVITCIGNRVIAKRLMREMNEKGFPNVIPGDYLYMGMLCPFTKETGINARRCTATMECRQIYCHRLGNIIKADCENENPIHLTSITLVINQKCSLRCKYCTSYMNEYPLDERKNFPLEQICKDIDVFFDAVDTVGTITVMGGEPFMHPDLSKIIEHLCTKKNFGLISIATSGTYPIKPEQLEGLYDKRVNVSFSNYTLSINEKQKELFYKNIEIVKEAGICHTVGLFSPEWIKPSGLYKVDVSDDVKAKLKGGCEHWHQVKNGKVHPCDFANSIYSLGVADYPTDYVDLTADVSREEMRKRLREYIERPFYESCGHHSGKRRMTAMAAEQGYYDFRNPSEDDEPYIETVY